MKILITGGCGFIGSHVAERFTKEGHDIYIIDDLSTGTQENLTVKHNFYCLGAADPKCEAIFRNNSFDIIIHLAATPDLFMDNNDCLVSQDNIWGLANMLELARKHGVQKFIYPSSISVYGNLTGTANEDTPVKPLSRSALYHALAESHCQAFRENRGLDIVVLRLSTVYGSRQSFDEKDFLLTNDQYTSAGYIYVDDAVDAIYKAATTSGHSPVLNVASGSGVSLGELDNSRIKQELGWQPKYSLAEGLAETHRWYAERHARRSKLKTIKKNSMFTRYRPYLENGTLFLLMGTISYASLNGSIMDFWVGLDYNYVYIAIMGLMYGKRQSLPAVLLSSILFIVYMMARGADFVSLIYQVQYLTHLATYLCVGVVTGYITDNRERVVADKDAELCNLQERHDFLQQMYDECLDIKDSLYSQIVNSDDSLGKIHGIVRELDSLRAEDTYTSAAGVISKVMKTDAVDIYTVTKDNSYLRLKVRSAAKACLLPKSIKAADYKYAEQLLQTKDVFVNKKLNQAYPDMAAPIIHDGKVIAVIQLYCLPFESLSLYHINLFRIAAMLISGALSRAYLHDSELRDIKYLPDTVILLPKEFDKVLAAARKRSELFRQEAAVLRLIEKPADYKQISSIVAGSIRAEDYIGMNPDGSLVVLLLNISSAMVAEVRKRLNNKGIFTEVVESNDVK